MRQFFLAHIALVAFSGFAQTTKKIEFWRVTPSLIEVNEDEYPVGDAIILEDNRLIKYVPAATFTTASRETTRHKIIHIKTQEGLDDNNKIAFYVPSEGKIIDIKARSISKDGKIVELNKDNIKKLEDYGEDVDLKMFAIEGAEVHGQIEFLYKYSTPMYDAGIERLSMDYPTRHATINIESFSGLLLSSKAFNCSDAMPEKTSSHYYVFSNIAPIAKEKYATPEANRIYIDYKIAGSAYQKTTYSSYNALLASLVPVFHSFDAIEERRANSVLRKCWKEYGEATNELENIQNLYHYLKKNFGYVDDYASKSSDLVSVFSSHQGNDLGLTKMYCALLDEMEVDYSVIYTNDKYECRVDENYCSRYMLDEYLIYLPQHKRYIYPSSQVIQFGLIPSWLVGNKGLVITDDKNYLKFTEIPSQHPDTNMTKLHLVVNIDPSQDLTTVKVNQWGMGQVAFDMNYDIYYAESEDEKKELLMNYINWRYPGSEVKSLQMITPEQWGDISKCGSIACPLNFVATVESNTMFENLGDKILFKVGDLIGPQTELYSETKRVQPITCAYNKSYVFKIEVQIPEGYKYAGQENVEINNLFEDMDKNTIAGFRSTIKTEEDKVVVEIYEFYAKINIDVAYYEDYRRIINSAADFNKSVIMFQKIE